MKSGKRWMAAAAMAVGTITIAAGAPALAEPERLTIGHPDIDGSFIRDHSARYELEMIAADGTSTHNGHWTDQVRIEEGASGPVLMRHVRLYDAAGTLLFERVHRADAATIAPIHVQQIGDPRFGGRFYDVTFDGAEVESRVARELGQPLASTKFEFSAAPFDYSIWATLLMSLPLEAGYEAEIPIFTNSPDELWETIKVVGEEEITLRSGETVSAWRVETEIRPWVAWVRKDEPYIARIIQNFPGGFRQISHPVAD